ncbi:hypothetical protein [Megamonas hypermegale]|uniref:hypothetical protein n=1 Tax=Megamonas hypermegale TaxID=158847 RepID=UPI0025A386C3|nr:hypothetical protein [Megamonas hypermegale]MDM8143158.1 hypothetical protein [Megamonas hypermegale]
MTSLDLAIAIADYLKEKNQYYFLSDEKYAGQKLLVTYGFLPKVLSNEDLKKNFPHLVVRFIEEKAWEENLSYGTNRVKIRVYFGTVNDDKDKSFLEIYTMLEQNKQFLLKKRQFGNYRLIVDSDKNALNIVIPEEQPLPQWVGYIDVFYEKPEIISEESEKIDKILRPKYGK